MFRHTIEQKALGKTLFNALAEAVLVSTSMLPLVMIALVTLR
jgi:hypothetical protein